MQQFISVVLIFPPTRVTVSLQGPDGDYEITAATAKLKCVNQKDLFVPAFWLEDMRTAEKLTRLEKSMALELDPYSALVSCRVLK